MFSLIDVDGDLNMTFFIALVCVFLCTIVFVYFDPFGVQKDKGDTTAIETARLFNAEAKNKLELAKQKQLAKQKILINKLAKSRFKILDIQRQINTFTIVDIYLKPRVKPVVPKPKTK